MSRSTELFLRDTRTLSYLRFAAEKPIALARLIPELERGTVDCCLLLLGPGERTENSSSPRICACARTARQDSEKTSWSPLST